MTKPPLRFMSDRTIKIFTWVDKAIEVAMTLGAAVLVFAGATEGNAAWVAAGIGVLVVLGLRDVVHELRKLTKPNPPSPTFRIRAPKLTADEAAKLRATLQDALRKDASP